MGQALKTDPAASRRTPPPGKITYKQFLAWLDEGVRAEWVNGEVILLSPCNEPHQALLMFLGSLMQHAAERTDAGAVRCAPFQMKTGAKLGGREPDIFFIARKNLHRLKDTYVDGPADIVVEIISADSRGRDRGEKFYEYEQGGVPEYWLLDQPRKQAEFYRRGKDGLYHLVPIGADGIFRSEVLDGFWIKVEWLWQKPLPTLMSVLKEWKLV